MRTRRVHPEFAALGVDTRRPDLQDMPSVASVVAHACARAYGGLFDEAALTKLITPEAIHDRTLRLNEEVASGVHEMLIACEGGDVVGVIGWRRDDDHVEVESLYVDPARWGSSAASDLVSALTAAGPRRLELWTLRDNLRARRFYERVGFRLADDIRRINYLDRDVEQVRYIRMSVDG